MRLASASGKFKYPQPLGLKGALHEVKSCPHPCFKATQKAEQLLMYSATFACTATTQVMRYQMNIHHMPAAIASITSAFQKG